jgi:hypothetical protein
MHQEAMAYSSKAAAVPVVQQWVVEAGAQVGAAKAHCALEASHVLCHDSSLFSDSVWGFDLPSKGHGPAPSNMPVWRRTATWTSSAWGRQYSLPMRIRRSQNQAFLALSFLQLPHIQPAFICCCVVIS